VLTLAPWVTVVGYELVGHRHNAQVLASLPLSQDQGVLDRHAHSLGHVG
jgi:hypothetical protein